MNRKCSKFAYKFCLWKAYFEKGYSLTSYLKYVILLFGLLEGIKTQEITYTLIVAVLYIFACFFLGWAWYHYGIIESEIEVTNNFNLFVKEMRKEINGKI
jgi:hypothetical protein